jgi:hypothetical protein
MRPPGADGPVSPHRRVAPRIDEVGAVEGRGWRLPQAERATVGRRLDRRAGVVGNPARRPMHPAGDRTHRRKPRARTRRRRILRRRRSCWRRRWRLAAPTRHEVGALGDERAAAPVPVRRTGPAMRGPRVAEHAALHGPAGRAPRGAGATGGRDGVEGDERRHDRATKNDRRFGVLHGVHLLIGWMHKTTGKQKRLPGDPAGQRAGRKRERADYCAGGSAESVGITGWAEARRSPPPS